MIVANFSLPGTEELQPGTSKPKRVNHNTRVLEFLPILCVPFCFLVVCGGCRRPGPELSRLRGLTQATRCQLSSPRGLESCYRAARVMPLGDCSLQPGSSNPPANPPSRLLPSKLPPSMHPLSTMPPSGLPPSRPPPSKMPLRSQVPVLRGLVRL